MKPREDRADRAEHGQDSLSFVVGAELKLREILSCTDLMPLFQTLLAAGAAGVAVEDERGAVLQSCGTMSNTGPDTRKEDANSFSPVRRQITFEGEAVGALVVFFPQNAGGPQGSGLTDLAATCLQMIVNATVKRMLATELHTTVVHQSYEELLDTNRRLVVSEKGYRELAETLELKVEERAAELKTAHARMLQQEKMASVGQLAAGMAHEINNPLGFIISNINAFEGYVQRMKEMMQFQGDLLSNSESALKKAAELWQRLKLDLVLQDAPELIRQSREGAERVQKIVANLKGFSHVDDAVEDFVNINEELDRTIGVLEHECRGRVTFIRHYGNLPRYLCRPGLICQVFLSIIQNALQASDLPVQIMITTAGDQGIITVKIEDDGPGIPESVLARVFEPFFTTKDVGQGTGLGLSVAYDIVREHGGDISVSSVLNEGAVFTVTLPLKEQANV